MSRKLDGEQQADLTDFVNSLAGLAGYTTTAEWARDSGYPASNLSNLRNGKGAVDGYNLLRLIRAASLRIGVEPIRMATERASAQQESVESIAHRLQSVEEGMNDLAALIREELVAEQADSEAPQAAPRKTPPKKARRRS